MHIIKRDGTEVGFDGTKIANAISKANAKMSDENKLTQAQIEEIAQAVIFRCEQQTSIVSVEDVQDFVEAELIARNLSKLSKEYITYRYKRQLARKSDSMSDNILSLLQNKNAVLKEENSNKNTLINSVQRDYMAGEVSKTITFTQLLPEDIDEANRIGDIHFHDADYFAQPMYNCCLINLQDMLENGTVISGTGIDTPHTFSTACNIATQIIAQVASNQYGGQTISIAHLAPFVERSRQKIREQIREECRAANLAINERQAEAILKSRLAKEIEKGVQTIQYQVITLMTTNGQAPFLSLCLYLNEARTLQEQHDLAMIIEEILKQRIQGVKNEKGVWVTPAFPKLLYILDENNCDETKPYWYLTELAAQCTAKRMVPDYISEKKMLEYKIDQNGNPQCYPCMGCRSFLTPYVDENGNPKYYGRFNQGVVTINLPAVGLTAKGDYDKFWQLLDEKLELCHRALRIRHERLLGTTSDVAPILWQYGAIARLEKGEKIDKLLYGGYSTISLGYAGLYECVKAMTGHSHTDPEAKDFALAVMQRLNDKCAEWRAAENIAYSVYGTPLESTTYKFAKALQKRFGIIEGITDKNYITNSYHVHVTEKIDAFTKLAFESEFQKLSPGGAISYIEVPDMTNNIPAVLEVVKFIYDNIMYAELNTKSDYCCECGYDGEIAVIEEDGKLLWECPQCGNRDQTKMSVARRTCGYIGTQFWNQGRTQEIKDRVEHL
jgi:ribonucleoside-triphosphate reductase